MAATGAASDVAGSTLTTTPTITSAIANGPVLNFIDKRRRALRKKCKRIIQMEESVSKGKILNKEQQEVLRYKISISHSIDELEKLRAPLATLVADEISLAIKSNQIKTSEFCTHPPANMRPDDMASVATGGNVGSADAPSLAPLNGSVVSDLQMDESVGQHQKMVRIRVLPGKKVLGNVLQARSSLEDPPECVQVGDEVFDAYDTYEVSEGLESVEP